MYTDDRQNVSVYSQPILCIEAAYKHQKKQLLGQSIASNFRHRYIACYQNCLMSTGLCLLSSVYHAGTVSTLVQAILDLTDSSNSQFDAAMVAATTFTITNTTTTFVSYTSVTATTTLLMLLLLLLFYFCYCYCNYYFYYQYCYYYFYYQYCYYCNYNWHYKEYCRVLVYMVLYL